MLLFPVYKGGQVCGRMTVLPMGEKTRFGVRVDNDRLGVYKAYAQNSRTGARLPIGVLVPGAQMLEIDKTIQNLQISAYGLTAEIIDSARVELVCLADSQARLLDVTGLFKDKMFENIAPQENAFVRQQGEARAVFVPYNGREFVFSFAFCLCRLLEIDRREYIVLGINNQGFPCIAGDWCGIIRHNEQMP